MKYALALALLVACEPEECIPALCACYEDCTTQELGLVSFSCDLQDVEESVCKCGEGGIMPEAYQ